MWCSLNTSERISTHLTDPSLYISESSFHSPQRSFLYTVKALLIQLYELFLSARSPLTNLINPPTPFRRPSLHTSQRPSYTKKTCFNILENICYTPQTYFPTYLSNPSQVTSRALPTNPKVPSIHSLGMLPPYFI